jgi:hypothetical protein
VPALIVADVPAVNWDGDDYRAKLFAWRPDGTPALWSAPGLPPGAAWEFAVPLAGSPVWLNLAGGLMPPGEEYALVVGLANGELVAFDQNLNVVGGLQARWGPIAVGAALAWAPTPDFDANLLCCVPPDTLVLLDGTGARRGEPLILSAVGDDDFTGFAAPPLPWPMPAGGWSVFGPDAWYRVRMDLDGLQLDPTIYPYSTQGSETVLRRALVMESDVATLLVFDETGVVGSWHLDTAGQVMVTSWSGDLDSGPLAEPAVADLDGNGRNDLILLTATHVHAYQADGVPLTGYPVALAEVFPLPDTTRIAGPVVVCDATGDGVNELFFTSDQGHLLGLDARGQLLERTPLLWGRTGPFGLAVGTDADTDGRILWLLESAGRMGPPLDRRFDNGKLVGYRMAGSGQQTSEWLGTAGGGHRLGPVGAATPLEAPAPWKQEVDRVIFYPNPTQGNDLTVRFFSHGDQAARLVIFNLEGEIVLKETIAVASGQVNEHRLELPSLVSGMYVCQLERQTSSGLQTSLTTLAVER